MHCILFMKYRKPGPMRFSMQLVRNHVKLGVLFLRILYCVVDNGYGD